MSSESGWSALTVAVGISEIPLMIMLGYFVGRQLGREQEGVALGTLAGVILLATFIIWAYKKSKPTRRGGKASPRPATER